MRGRPLAPGVQLRVPPAAGHVRNRKRIDARRRPDAGGPPHRYQLFASLLDARLLRLFAGLESLKGGWAGTDRQTWLLGIDIARVSADGGNSSSRCRPGETCGACGQRHAEKNCRNSSPVEVADTTKRPCDTVRGLKSAAPNDGDKWIELRTLGIHGPRADRSIVSSRPGFLCASRHDAHRRSHPNRGSIRDGSAGATPELRRREHPDDQRRYQGSNSLAVLECRRSLDRVPDTRPKDHDFRSKPRAAPSPTGSTIRRPIPARLRRRVPPDRGHLPSTASKSGGAPSWSQALSPGRNVSRSWPTAGSSAAPRCAWKFHLTTSAASSCQTARDRRPLPPPPPSKWFEQWLFREYRQKLGLSAAHSTVTKPSLCLAPLAPRPVAVVEPTW